MPDDMWPLTGLPHLPEGYFWRVALDTIFNKKNTPNIEIRQKRLIGSKYVFWSAFYPYANLSDHVVRHSDYGFIRNISEVTPEMICATAVILREQLQAERDNKARADVLLGDYPPKKLEV